MLTQKNMFLLFEVGPKIPRSFSQIKVCLGSPTSHPKSTYSLEAPREEKSGVVRNTFPLNKLKKWCSLSPGFHLELICLLIKVCLAPSLFQLKHCGIMAKVIDLIRALLIQLSFSNRLHLTPPFKNNFSMNILPFLTFFANRFY